MSQKDCLAFTGELDHFASKGDPGAFFISYSCYEMQDNGSILCKVSRSSDSDIDCTIQ